MNSGTVAHRWANKDFGRNNTLTASTSCHSKGRNYFSYSTVFGQWLDLSKNVVAVFDGSTSPTSSKYKLYKGYFSDDVHVFPLDLESSSYYGWRNCNVVSSYDFRDEDFKDYHRMKMIDHYVDRIFSQFESINGGTKKGLENVSFEAWGYIEDLCSLYKDTSIAKWLKRNSFDKNIKLKKKMARLLKSGERDVPTITDSLFGEGTYKKYWDYCARFRKTETNREKVKALCRRLCIASPYTGWDGIYVLRHEMTAKQIRNLSARERNDLHFAALDYIQEVKNMDARRNKSEERSRNAYKWIVGTEPQKRSWGYEFDIETCINKDTKEVYELESFYVHGIYWAQTSVSFDAEGFRKSPDKEQWISDFYAMCKEVSDNIGAIKILKRIHAHEHKNPVVYDTLYVDDDYLRENTTDEEYALCCEFIRKQDEHVADAEVRERLAAIEKARRKEEERKEREYQKSVTKERIAELIAEGIEGCRDLWRLHIQDIRDSICNSPSTEGEFFYNGNVLLRMSMNKDKVETSKGIRIPIDVCKKMWVIINKWHENPKSFKSMQIDTKVSGKYTISAYENDIMTAGCHRIAYAEMERMYKEIA